MVQRFTVHYVGSEAEVAHHAAPLREEFHVALTPPDLVASVARVGDVALFFTEHFDRFRRAIGELRQAGIATLYALDGILEWRHAWEHRPDEPACPWTMRPVLCHKVACIGQNQARILRSWGNGPKVEVVGLPRLDHIVRSRDLPGCRRPAPADDHGSSSPLRILVVTAKFPGFTSEQLETTLRSLRDLIRWHREHPQIAGRPVRLTWRLTHGLDRELGVENALNDVRGTELVHQIEQNDLVISTASTALLESMLLGRPTILLDYHAVPTYVPAAWTIRHPGDFDPILVSASGLDSRRMAHQEYLLHDQLECHTPAQPRLAALIRELQATSLQHTGALSSHLPQSLESPLECCPTSSAQPQSPAAAPLTTAELAAWFPDHFGGAPTATTEAAAELAHARREIENLHRRIAQLSSELGSAHEIFRQIHAHPIAGPVVRTRQRLLDLVQQWSGPRNETDPNRS